MTEPGVTFTEQAGHTYLVEFGSGIRVTDETTGEVVAQTSSEPHRVRIIQYEPAPRPTQGSPS